MIDELNAQQTGCLNNWLIDIVIDWSIDYLMDWLAGGKCGIELIDQVIDESSDATIIMSILTQRQKNRSQFTNHHLIDDTCMMVWVMIDRNSKTTSKSTNPLTNKEDGQSTGTKRTGRWHYTSRHIDRSKSWLTGRFAHCEWLISSIDWFVVWLTEWFTSWLVDWSIDCL